MDSSKRRSIALIGTDLSGGGGVNRIIRDLSDLFSARLGFDTLVLSARSAAVPTYPFSPGVRLEAHPEGKTAWGYIKLLWRLRRRRFDYVVGFWPQDNLLAALLLWLSGTRVILTEHISWYFPSKPIQWLRRLGYRLGWRVVVLNDADLDYYSRFLGNVRLLPNVVPEPERHPFPPPREKLVLAVGHLEPLKNLGDAVQAMADSGLEASGWSLAIVGSGSERARLESLISKLKLTRTTLHAPTADIADWYARASVVLVTSRIEVFSLVLVEAIRSGAAPLAYAADGPKFILRDFPDHLVPVGDVKRLAVRLRDLASDPRLDERAEAIRACVGPRFSADTIAEQWRTLLA